MGDVAWIIMEGIFAGVNTALKYLFLQAFLKEKSEVYVVWKIVSITRGRIFPRVNGNNLHNKEKWRYVT